MAQQMALALDLSFAHMEGRWRLPGSWVGATFPDLAMYRELAMIAERGGLDMIFFGDGTGIPSAYAGSRDAAVHWGVGWPRQDMSPFIAALAQSTSRIGFGLTYSSTYMHPYYVARLLNSLDHVTAGRIAFNVVTSSRPADAANYGFDALMDHDARYRRMEEFIDVCRGLWNGVEPDAFIWDRDTGQVADPAKIHAIDHRGEFFSVAGPLTCVPSPQIEPVLIQAGGSPRGIAACASFADLAFAAGRSLERVRAHRAALDEQLLAAGRQAGEVGILWDLQLVVAPTQAEARARKQALFGLLPPEAVGTHLSANTGYDFSRLPTTFVLGELHDRIVASQSSPMGVVGDLIAEHGREYEMSREEFFEIGWKQVTGYDHTIAGTPGQVADELEEIFEAAGSRGGFMMAHPLVTPRDLVDVVGLLVPELRRRGRLPERYGEGTLRERLGLSRRPRAGGSR